LELTFVDLKSDWTKTETHEVTLKPNQATELLAMPCPGPDTGESPTGDEEFTNSYSVVVGARLLVTGSDAEDADGEKVLARTADWPQPLRFVEPALLRDPGLAVTLTPAEDDITLVQVSAICPVKGLWLSAAAGEGPDVRWSDNSLDVMPGDPRVVRARGLRGRGVEVAFLGWEKAGV
jgi:beta-mannosidase